MNENPFKAGPTVTEKTVEERNGEARLKYLNARRSFDLNIEAESSELKLKFDALLSMYREKFGEKGEMFVFKLVNIDFSIKLHREDWRREIGEDTIRTGFERMLRVLSSDKFLKLLDLYPSLLEDFDINYATDGLWHDNCSWAISERPLSCVQVAFNALIRKRSFDRSFRNKCGAEQYPAVMDALERSFDAYLEEVTSKESKNVLTEYAQLYEDAMADQEAREFIQKNDYHKPSEHVQEMILNAGLMAAIAATDRLLYPGKYRNEQDVGGLDPAEGTREVFRKIILPSVSEYVSEHAEAGLKLTQDEYGKQWLGENLGYEWARARGNQIAWFYEVAEDAWGSYSRLLEEKRVPRPEDISAAVAFDAEGRAAGRMLKRFWQESGAEQQPTIYFLNPKHLSKRGKMLGFKSVLGREEALELIREEYPGLIKDIRNGGKDVLLVDATIDYGRTLSEMKDLFSGLVGDDRRIKIWTLTGHTDVHSAGDSKLFGNWDPGGGTGFIAPDASPGAKPTLYSRKSEKYDPTEMGALTNEAMDRFFGAKHARGDGEALGKMADEVFGKKQYMLLKKMSRVLPLTRQQCSTISSEALANDNLSVAKFFLAEYFDAQPAQP